MGQIKDGVVANYTSLHDNILKSDIVIALIDDDIKIIKSRYGCLELEYFNFETVIIKLFKRMLKNKCGVDFFLDSFEIDLLKAMREVFKNYNLKVDF